ncbi:hypothetical protein ZWY2020_021790 [Hordeum vulgare]|nr:hypothetical protein ZWY2020_021790 [Hordeum vulgare]
MMEEGSSKAAVQDGGALSAPSVGTEAVIAVVRKMVKMFETHDFTPCTDASEVTSSAGGAASRLRTAPLQLFSAAGPLPLAVLRPPAKPVVPDPPMSGGARARRRPPLWAVDQRAVPHVVAKEYDSLLREKGECRRVLEDLMMENKLSTKECREAQTSLRDLHMEVMRKFMHVGSLVEGQVKEKTRCCQLLKDPSEKFKVLKAEHQILLKESEDYKKCLSDAYRAQRLEVRQVAEGVIMYWDWLKQESLTWMRPGMSCKLEAKPELLVPQMLTSTAADHTGKYLIVLTVLHQFSIHTK